MRIDAHAHYFPTAYLDRLERCGSAGTTVARQSKAGAAADELAERFALMAASGIDRQLLSVGPQLPYFSDKGQAGDAARHANDLYAEIVACHPDRLMALGVVPLPHVDAALAETARVLDDLGFAGIAIGTSILGRSIADPAFEPFYAELDRRATLLQIHPAGCGACSPLITDHALTWPVGAPIEDTIAIAQLIGRGLPHRYPRIRFLASHLGGALPMLLQRMDAQAQVFTAGAPEAPSATARRLWYDTVSHGSAAALRCACDGFGADRLVFGTDFPYKRGAGYAASLRYIAEAGLPEAAAADIADRNGARLLDLE